MSKKTNFIQESDKGITLKKNQNLSMLSQVLTLVSILILSYACSQPAVTTGFNPSKLSQLGDTVHYGSYIIYKIGDGTYRLCDKGTPGLKGGGLVGVDMYLICGKEKALLIDLGNNYMDGYAGDLITPRANAKEQFLDVVYKLIGKLPLEIAVTHAHPDHSGMTTALDASKVTLWIGEGEDMQRLKTMHNIDPSIYKIFKQGEKTFDLGGGRTVETFLVRGHSNGGTVLLLKPDMQLFTGDAIGPGPRRKRELRTAEALTSFTEDINKLVNNLKAELAPYDRYRLQVYTGHSAEMIFHATKTDVVDNLPEDAGYGEWRYVQDMANVANAIKEGTWFDANRGFYHFEVPVAAGAKKQIQIVFYLGALILPEEVAYGASGMKVPEVPAKK